MNDYKQQHIKKKNSIIECLKTAEEFLTAHDHIREAESISAQRENVENGEFSIAVVGEFSAGKSTFLNALMGEKILPSFTSETTATINFLRHEDEAKNGEKGVVYFKNDVKPPETLMTADADTIMNYVTTKSSHIKVAESISHLDLFLKSKFLEDKVTLVDTPGLNGKAEGHREITEEQIEKSSMGIFLFDANQPGSRSDFEFISDLRKRVTNIIFVLNKIDNIKSSEGETVESVIKKLKESYKHEFPETKTVPEIWPVAAYPALVARSSSEMDYHDKASHTPEEKARYEEKSRMSAFENRLWRFLTMGEKAHEQLLAPITQLMATLCDIKKAIDAEINALSDTVDLSEIEEQQQILNKSLAELNEQLSSKTDGIKRNLKRAQQELYEELNAECERAKTRYNNRIENFTDVEEIATDNLEKNIKKDFVRIGTEAYQNYLDKIETIRTDFAIAVTDELNADLSDKLNMKLDRKMELPTVTMGLEEFDRNITEMKDEIEKLSNEVDKSEIDLAVILDCQARMDDLKRKIEDKQRAKELYEETSYTNAPQAKYKVEYKEVVTKRYMLDFLFHGNSHEMRPIEIMDTRERDEYLANRQQIIDKRDSEITDLQKELDKFVGGNSTAAQVVVKRKNEKLSQKKAELRQYETDYAEKIKKEASRQLRLQKNAVSAFLDEIADEYITKCKSSFQKDLNAQIVIITDLAGGAIKKQIELKQKDLELLIKKRDNSVAERNERIRLLNEEKDGIRSILEKAIDLESQIKDMECDVIKEETLPQAEKI